jgi:hypothetical protein
VCTQTEQSSNQYNNKQENHSKQKLQPEEERLLEDTPSNHHTTLMVGRLLASTKKSERKQNLLNQTRLRERKQKPGGRHESLPGKKDQRWRETFLRERGSGFKREREARMFYPF